jgi:2-polyprenyl-6-methoxyphenol hydroxylase-like FAD-dependent oxidoreductase
MTRFLIIGGGIAGPVAALRLVQDGHQCTLYERSPEPRTIGGAVSVAPNGMRLLEKLELRSKIENMGCMVDNFEIKDDKGGDIGMFCMKSKDGYSSVRIMRRKLQEVLLDECEERGIEVHFGKALEHVAQDEKSITARFADGSSANGDFIIGADGIHSKTRDFVTDEPVKAKHTGSSIVYGILPTDSLSSIDFSNLPSTMGVSAPAGFFSSMFTDNEHSQLYWVTIKAKPSAQLDTNKTRAQELARFKDTFAPIPEVISATNEFFAWDIHELPRLSSWSKGKIVLVGDAAHALPPNQGQGVSQAIEDIFVLANVIAKNGGTEDFSKYFDIRRPQVDKLRESFKGEDKQAEKGPWAHWFRVWGFWGMLKVVNLERIVPYWDRYGIDVDEIAV